MPELINPRAERVRSIRALSGRSARFKAGRFVVEGPQGVREAVRFAPEQVRDVYFSVAASERFSEIASDVGSAHLRMHVASDEVMTAMSPDAQGVLAVLTMRAPSLDEVLAGGPLLVALLSNVRDPGNAGTVIRAADAAGADAVILTSSSVDIHNPKTVRSTAGSLFHLPVVTGLDLPDVVASLRAHGLGILAADGSGAYDLDDLLDKAGGQVSRATVPVSPRNHASASVPSDGSDPGAPDLSAPTAWLFGNEAWGLRPEEIRLADSSVRVPIRGAAESLNLATAATVCLYGSSRAQRHVVR